jgi:dihydropteroate synthase
MGIVNATPDSFSDGGQLPTAEAAIRHGLELVRQGADLLDVGGESTRPGATAVPVAEELARVVPVIRGLVENTEVPLSVDTSKAEVARQALAAGAAVVNDVTALRGDPGMPAVVREFRAGVILMHMRGEPATMQDNPTYGDVAVEVRAFLEERLQAALDLGIASEQVVLDPGIGFGKTADHNFRLLARLGDLRALGRPVCMGVSRKGFLGKLLGREVGERMAGSLAAACFALAHHTAGIVRVHDVAATRDAVRVISRLEQDRTGR